MPPSRKKEPKETVTYPASKRKPPPFKPQRPSKLPRVSTTESESSVKPTKSPKAIVIDDGTAGAARSAASGFGNNKPFTAPKAAASKAVAGKKGKAPAARAAPVVVDDDDDEDEEEIEGAQDRRDDPELSQEDSDDILEDNPLTAKPRKPAPAPKEPRNPAPPARLRSPSHSPVPSLSPEPEPFPPDSNTIPGIPQALLTRLLYEHFRDKTTKIDKQALAVLGKYFEVFVREAIARTALERKRKEEEGVVASQSDVGWLEREDLEVVAGGMILDF